MQDFLSSQESKNLFKSQGGSDQTAEQRIKIENGYSMISIESDGESCIFVEEPKITGAIAPSMCHEEQRNAYSSILDSKIELIKIQEQNSQDDQLSTLLQAEQNQIRKSSLDVDAFYTLQKQPKGIPNHGNWCFILCVIQFLFPATKYREYIISLSSKEPIRYYGNMFKMLKSQKEHKEYKKREMTQLLKQIEKINLNYQINNQEDAFETMNNILLHLGYSLDQKKKIKEMFELKARIKCLCIQKEFFISQMYTSFVPETCVDCDQVSIAGYKKDSHPQYLILKDYSSKKNIFQINQRKYQLLSHIFYYGNGDYGHYVCHRFHNGKQFKISDNFVTQVCSNCRKNNHDVPFFSLFKKLPQNYRQEEEEREEEDYLCQKCLQQKKNEKKPKMVDLCKYLRIGCVMCFVCSLIGWSMMSSSGRKYFYRYSLQIIQNIKNAFFRNFIRM